ncbi:ANTAR domain-containing protein [Streptomyces sp. NBC_00588]|uniref:ANTAR domain-containing protein n=1 Tax=Streptomyces sp. NBC_00588 TaxID=2975784 RepID=UPI002E82156A|nr:ANTAR domain-containing protein [Streptomyces sp. NBC_00588]WUB36589.1 ANTAR domain-containing protein [Streptomyces sp. NBC_00588]
MIGDDEGADRVASLQAEVLQLRRAVESHAIVDQAIGVVITVAGLRPDQGWQVLKHISQHTNLKLREVARCLVGWPSGSPLPDVIRRALPHAVDHARRVGADGAVAVAAVACGSP